MTVIVGLLCKEGIVIASDSEESDEEQGLKRLDVKKVYDTANFDLDQGDIEIIVAGTGTSAYISRVAEWINENIFAPRFSMPRQVADVVEDALGRMKDRYGAGLDLEVLVGVYCKDAPKHGDEVKELPSPVGLYSISCPEENEKVGVAEIVRDYAAMGSGGLFAHYLLNRLHDEDNPVSELTMDAAVREAVYVISEVVKVDLWCGGDIQVACIKRDGDAYTLERKRPNDVKRLVLELSEADRAVKESERKC
jgi:20S proteasome alpha/beta subunit